jgi:hypothetical protein
MFPAMRESKMSDLCMCCAQKIILSTSTNSDSQRNKYTKTLLYLFIYLIRNLCLFSLADGFNMVVHIVTVWLTVVRQ